MAVDNFVYFAELYLLLFSKLSVNIVKNLATVVDYHCLSDDGANISETVKKKKSMALEHTH